VQRLTLLVGERLVDVLARLDDALAKIADLLVLGVDRHLLGLLALNRYGRRALHALDGRRRLDDDILERDTGRVGALVDDDALMGGRGALRRASSRGDAQHLWHGHPGGQRVVVGKRLQRVGFDGYQTLQIISRTA
jgi:hypothetical protein